MRRLWTLLLLDWRRRRDSLFFRFHTNTKKTKKTKTKTKKNKTKNTQTKNFVSRRPTDRPTKTSESLSRRVLLLLGRSTTYTALQRGVLSRHNTQQQHFGGVSIAQYYCYYCCCCYYYYYYYHHYDDDDDDDVILLHVVRP